MNGYDNLFTVYSIVLLAIGTILYDCILRLSSFRSWIGIHVTCHVTQRVKRVPCGGWSEMQTHHAGSKIKPTLATINIKHLLLINAPSSNNDDESRYHYFFYEWQWMAIFDLRTREGIGRWYRPRSGHTTGAGSVVTATHHLLYYDRYHPERMGCHS